MFENLRDAFREAIENFNKELNRDQVPESVDRLLVGMRGEVVEAKTRIGELEEQLQRSLREADADKQAAETARRREGMARQIGDSETAAVAAQFATKHEERRRLLAQKASAIKQELDFLEREHEEMLAKYEEAKSKRDALAATAGRTGARASLDEAEDLFSELDRMAAKIGDEEARGDAARAFGDSDLHIDMDAPPPPEIDFDARLDELKRRMRRE
jgi:phage shock protein A